MFACANVLNLNVSIVCNLLNKYYDWNRNKGIGPYSLYISADVLLYWKCPDCNYEWSGRLYYLIHKAKNKSISFYGCSRCKGESNRWKITEVPRLMRIWVYEKNSINGIYPENYTVHAKIFEFSGVVLIIIINGIVL